MLWWTKSNYVQKRRFLCWLHRVIWFVLFDWVKQVKPCRFAVVASVEQKTKTKKKKRKKGQKANWRLQYLVCQIEVSFICSIGILSYNETLELLAAYLSFGDCFPVWPLLGSVLFVELFHLYLFVTIASVVDSLNHSFLLLGECRPLLPCVDCYTYASIFQWNCPT